MGNTEIEELLNHWAHELSGYCSKEIQYGLTHMAHDQWPRIPASVPMLQADLAQRTETVAPEAGAVALSDEQESTEPSRQGLDLHITLALIKMTKVTLGHS